MPRLVIRGPDGDLREVSIDARSLTLGRDPSCDVTLHDRLVSRQHLTISVGYVLQDSNSFNGLFVRGKRVDRAFLFPGDTFEIGSEGHFEVQLLDDDAPLGLRDPGPAGGTLADGTAADDPAERMRRRCRELQDENERLRRDLAEARRVAQANAFEAPEVRDEPVDRPSTMTFQKRRRHRRPAERADTPSTSGTTG